MDQDLKDVVWPEWKSQDQLANLGFSLEAVAQISGPVLDIGCGSKANLVYYLRSCGVYAEGIDPRVSNGIPFLMRQAIEGIHPSVGSIHRKDDFYQLVLSHMNCDVYGGLSSLALVFDRVRQRQGVSAEALRQQATDRNLQASVIICESLRVLNKKSGKLICFPSLDLLEERLGAVIAAQGFVICNEKNSLFDDIPLEFRSLIAAIHPLPEVAAAFIDACDYRTVITPRI